MGIKIVSDSACDLTMQEAKDLNVDIIPLKVCFDNEEYLDGINLTHKAFFEKLIETDKLPTSSQVSPYEFEEKFTELTANGDTLVCIILSSKLSGTFQSATIAASEFENQVFLVDSLNASLGQRILVELAVRLRDEGKSASQIKEILDEEKTKIRLLALLDTLEYLKKGGRISPAVAAAANILSIKPVIAVENGEVVLVGKARGSKAANNKLTELIMNESGICFDKPMCLAYSGLSDILLKKYLADMGHLYLENPDDIPICSIGSVIGTHIGPGAIGVTFFAK